MNGKYFNDNYSSIDEFRDTAEKVIAIKLIKRNENKMKKYYEFFEKERMLYVVSVVKGDKVESSLHMGRMQGYKKALSNMGVDFTKLCYLQDRIMTSIDFAYRMERRYRKAIK